MEVFRRGTGGVVGIGFEIAAFYASPSPQGRLIASPEENIDVAGCPLIKGA